MDPTRDDEHSDLTKEEFDSILAEILEETHIETILEIPGVYDLLAEALNDEVIKTWKIYREVNEAMTVNQRAFISWLLSGEPWPWAEGSGNERA